MTLRALLGALALASSSPHTSSAAPVRTLAGEWRVAGIDGKSVDGPIGLALRGDRAEIWWEPSCAGLLRRSTIRGSRVSTAGYSKAEAPPLICLIAPPREMADVFVALDAAKRIRRTVNNGVEISGDGHSLLLFSQ